MELKTITKNIDGVEFLINQFPARQAERLELRTVKYFSPLIEVLEGIKSLDLEAEVDFSKIVSAIKNTLASLNENEVENYITEMVSFTGAKLVTDGKETIYNLKIDNDYDAVFRGRSLTLYKLLLEIMRANKMFFFELLGGGGNLIDIFQKMMPKIEKSEIKLEKSGS